MSIYVIKFINFNSSISSLLALNLLWYPAFENLFTIIRRMFAKKKVGDDVIFVNHDLLKKKSNQLIGFIFIF